MLVEESYVNATEGHRIGDSGIYDAWPNTIGDLYRAMQREYGRCVSKVYIDTDNGPMAIGWVFVKRQKYQDCNDTYLQETWITVHKEEPKRTVEYFYQEI